MAALFLTLSTISFVGVLGWMNREEILGRNPKKHIAIGVYTAVLIAFLIIFLPRS